MDFVAKKALDVQLKKVTKPFQSSSNPHNTSVWAAFTKRTSVKPQDSDTEAKPFHYDTECAFDGSPNNFPPLLNLCYIDRSILSDAALAPVTWAFRLFFWFVILLFFNTAVAFFFMILDKGSGWLHVLIATISALFLAFYQLLVYETAFRGAYRTSTNLKKRYLTFSAMNIPLILLCAAIDVMLFSRWIDMQGASTGANGENLILRKVPMMVVFLGWTALLFSNIQTIFEYYHLYRSEAPGLSPSALEAALKANKAREKQSELEHGEAQNTKRAKVQEIRDRYGIQ